MPRLFTESATFPSRESPSWRRLFSAKVLVTALAFGLAAAALVLAGVVVPVSGTTMVMDPREIFTTLGSALCGPAGAIIIAVLVSFVDPNVSLRPISFLYHLTGGLWVCFAYRSLIRRNWPSWGLIGGWIFIVLADYYLVMGATGLIAGYLLPKITVHSITHEIFEGRQTGEAVLFWLYSVIPEAAIVTFITTMILGLLPKKYRQPLW